MDANNHRFRAFYLKLSKGRLCNSIAARAERVFWLTECFRGTRDHDRARILVVPSGKSTPPILASSPTRGALRDRHDRWVRDAMDVIARETNVAGADGEVVWSWRPDAGVKFAGDDLRATVAREPGHRREHEVTVKTIAQGMPVDGVVTCGD
jgi:hypothetical protein